MVSRPAPNTPRDERNSERAGVAQIVQGVGEQGETAGQQPPGHLHQGQSHVDTDRRHQTRVAPTAMVRRVAVRVVMRVSHTVSPW